MKYTIKTCNPKSYCMNLMELEKKDTINCAIKGVSTNVFVVVFAAF